MAMCCQKARGIFRADSMTTNGLTESVGSMEMRDARAERPAKTALRMNIAGESKARDVDAGKAGRRVDTRQRDGSVGVMGPAIKPPAFIRLAP